MFARVLTFSSLAVFAATLAFHTPALSQNSAQDDGESSPASVAGKAYLGLQLGPVPKLLATHLPDVLEADNGLVIYGMDAESPAAKAGLESSDILVAFDGKTVSSYDKLIEYMSGSEPGQRIELTVIRRGKPLQVKVELGQRPADFAADVPLGGWPLAPGIGDFPEADDFPQMKESLEKMNKMMEQMNEDFGKRFGRGIPPMPAMPAMPKLDPDSFSSSAQSSTSSSFSSINVNKIGDDRYRVTVKYRAKDGEIRELNIEGTAEEIREAVKEDEKMPASVQEQIRRSLVLGSSDSIQSGALGNLSEMRDMLKSLTDDRFGFDDINDELPSLRWDEFNRL